MRGLASGIKAASLTRIVAPEETVRTVRGLASLFGVARLAEITGLDRVGIPTVSAIVPRSADIISVCNGKGTRRAEAVAGALMEAIERQAVIRARPHRIKASVKDLRGRVPFLEPAAIVSNLSPAFTETQTYEWIQGYDLIGGREVLTPAALAGYCWWFLDHGAPHMHGTTHGLAAGNSIEEAVCQALCEWVERDAWTLAELACYWHPRAMLEFATGRDPVTDFVDSGDRCPCIDLTGIGEPVEGLLRRFRRAGLDPMVRNITSDLGIPVVLAAVAEDEVPGFPQAHMGVGAHPDLRVAASRALSEAAQSRAADIQGVREDLSDADGSGRLTGVAIHTRRVRFIDRRRWLHRRSSDVRPWRDIQDTRNHDIADDIRLLLDRLAGAGIRQVVVVDFSPVDSGVFVVRVLIPGLEMWIADHGRVGERAAGLWRRLTKLNV